MRSMERYIGWIGVLVVLVNGAIFRRRALALGIGEPEKKASYLAIASAFVVWLVPPMALWAVAITAGWSEPLPKGPLTLFDHVCIAATLAVLARSCVWIYGQDGAEHLVQHRRLFDNFPSTARGVKLLWAVMSLGVVVGWVIRSNRGGA
jgi:hypothetical protein